MSAAADAGPLIALAKLDLLALLPQLYHPVLLAPSVYNEVVTEGLRHGHADALAVQEAVERGAFRVVLLSERDVPPVPRAAALGVGERHTIALALRERVELVLLDDLSAREQAAALGLQV